MILRVDVSSATAQKRPDLPSIQNTDDRAIHAVTLKNMKRYEHMKMQITSKESKTQRKMKAHENESKEIETMKWEEQRRKTCFPKNGICWFIRYVLLTKWLCNFVICGRDFGIGVRIFTAE